MAEDQYCLKWNQHQSTIVTVLSNLMDSERMADIILSAEGKMLKAHQVVITACSPYLEKLINSVNTDSRLPILIFNDLTFDKLVALKEYMYKGEVNVKQDELDAFLNAAKSLHIKGLADADVGDQDDGGGGGGKVKDEVQSAGNRRRRRRNSVEDNDASNNHSNVDYNQQERQAPVAKRQNVFSSSVTPYDPTPQIKMEPVAMEQSHHPAQVPPPLPAPQVQMKPEPQEAVEPETHDLTGLDDEYEEYDMPGTSQPDQDMANWENSMNSEDFAASQSANIMNAQQQGQSSQDAKIMHACVACGRTYSHRKNLQRHIKYECGVEPQFKCPLCPHKTNYAASLRKHVLFVHNPQLFLK